MLQRSIGSGLILSAAVFAAGLLGPAAPVPAQATAAAVAGTSAVDQKLVTCADDFLHYSVINNAELARANGEVLLAAEVPPEQILQAFEIGARNRDFRAILLQNRQRAELSEVSTKLSEKVEEGFRNVARNPLRIRGEVDRLGNGPRAYQNAKDRLTAAGQFAVPIYLEYLQDVGKKELHPFILRVMGEIGRPLINPLIEQLRVSDPALRVEIINTIGKIGYPQALPALRAVQVDTSTPAEVKLAVDNAIALIDRTGQAATMKPSELYLLGAQNYYEKKASYQPLHPDEKANPIWIFDPAINNVSAVQVPTPIWNSVMSLRLAEATLKNDLENDEAISLWLAASLRRELLLPAGASDPTKTPGAPEAAFYAMAAGPKYVNPVLARALDARDAALALRAIAALEATGGVQGLVADAESPLVRALAHPDRSVRFNAGFALARANPTVQFPSFFRVVPILAEAVSSSGTPNALIVIEDENLRNALTDVLRTSAAGYAVHAGATLSAALERAQRAPAIDVVIVPAGVESSVRDIGRNDYRLTGVPVLVMTAAANVPTLNLQFERTGFRGFIAVDRSGDLAVLDPALQRARAEVGSVPLTADDATRYALTSLNLLNMLASDHRSIYSVSEAVPALIGALKDSRPQIAMGAAEVLGKLNSPEGQRALAPAALDGETPAELRIVFFEQLAESAKRTGNVLDALAVNNLIKVVSSDPDGKVRIAAATALGALNVPSNQASRLILQQSR